MNSALDFEQPIVDLEAKIEELRRVDADGGLDLQREIGSLQQKSLNLQGSILIAQRLANYPGCPTSPTAAHPRLHTEGI